MSSRLLTFLTFFFFANAVFAQQVYPVSLTGLLIPPHSLDLSVYGTQRAQDLIFTAALTDPIEPYRDARLKLYIENNGQTLYTTDPNYGFPTLRLNMNQPVNLDGFALQPYLQPEALIGAAGQGQGSVIVPEGLNRLCLEVIDLERNVPISRKTCVTGGFFLNEPPILQMPACGGNVPQADFLNQTFAWMPLHLGSGNSPAPVEYLFQLVELPPGVDPNDGFDFSLKIMERTTMSPSLIYGPTDPILQPGQMYAWRVQASNMLKPGLIFRNYGKSQVCTFVYGDGFAPFGGSQAAEQMEEDRVAPQGCQVFDTDFGPIFTQDYTPVPLAEGDVVKIGWFEMTVADATPSGSGYSGSGFVKMPMLNTHVLVKFTNLKAKPNTLRCYEAGSIEAVCDNQFYLDPATLSGATMGSHFTPQFFQNLKNWFTDGQGQNRLVSRLDPNAAAQLPIGLDKQGSPLVAITGIRFTPRNCYLTAASYPVNTAGKTMNYAGLNIEIVPNGVRNNSFLSPLDGSANQVFAQIFKLEYKAGPNSIGMSVDCAGFAGYELQTEFSIDPEIMMLANGGDPVKFGLEDEGSDPRTYLGKVKKFDDFKLPKLPGFLFSMKNGALDLNENQKIEQVELATAQKEAWRGLYLGAAEVTLPAEYDFTGNGKAITLDRGSLALDAQGGHGHFSKTNLISLDKGRIGSWHYSVDSVSLNIVDGAAQNTRLAGQLQVPVLDEPFHYAGELKINGDDARLTISPQPGQRGMSLWNAKLDIEPDAKVDAVLRDFGPQGKKFMPDADLSGMFSMDFSSKQFEDRLVGNKGIIKSRLKQIFGYSLNAAPSFQLKDLKLEHLTIDPTQLPDDRYKLDGFQAYPDGLNIGGTKAQVAEVRLKYREEDGQGNEELGFEVVVRKGTNLVQFTFFAKTNPQTGGFQFDRIEVKTEEVECDCHAYVPHNEVDPSDMGLILERVYDNYLAPQKMQPGSGLAGGSALDLAVANAELLAAYKQATIAELQKNMVGGFPVLGDNEIVIPFFNKNNGGLKVACMKNGTEYTALTHTGFTRSGTNFDYNHLLNHLPAPTNGVWKLPLDVTDSLNLMGFERTDFPENTRLLITGIRLTGNSDVKSASKALFDFTLVAKIDDKTDAVFVKTDVEVGPTSVSGKNFYLYLDEDVSLNSPGVFNSKAGNKTLKLKASQPEAGTESSSENHSYAFMTCTEGFKTFNVQGEYAVPFDSGRLKVRDLSTNKAEDALKNLTLGFVIHDHKAPLTEFIAAIKEKTAEGEPLRFVVDGEEGLVFTAEKKIDAYLDFNASENDLAHMPDAPADFMGLYFEEIEIAIEGIDTTGGPYKADARNFYFLPGSADDGKNGMVGKFEKNGNVIKYEDGLKIGGWNYALDTLSINFTDANSDGQGGNACSVSGRTHCPIFKEFYESKPELMGFSGMLKWEKDEATVSGEEGTSVIQPVADFSLGKKNEFQASWLPGMVVMLDKESTLSFEWNFQGNNAKGGFLPVAEMNGKAMVFFTKKLAGQMEGGSEEVNSWGIDFGLPGLQFEGMSVNKAPEEDTAPDDPETVDIKDPAIGLKYLCLGEWGFGLEGLLGDKDDPKSEEERNEERAEKRKEIREHLAKNGGMNGFPLSIDKPTFGVTNKAEIFMELAITVNLLQEKLAEDTKTNKKLVNQIEKDGSSSKVNSTGIVATTVLRFYSKMVKGKGVLPDRVGLQQIAVAGAFGPVEIAGALQFLKAETPAEEEWGEGFKAYCDFRFGKSPDGSYKFQAKAMTQFGAVTRATENGGKKYRYFFADLEAGLPSPGRHLSYGIFLVGVGGGIYVNMEKQSPATYEAPGEAEEEEEDLIETSTDGMFKAIDDELMKPGRSLSGFEYKPKYQSYGGYFKGIFDWVSPKQMLFDIAVGIEVGFNTAGKFCFKKVFAKGDAYVFADNMADRTAAPIKASAEIEVDIANGQISAAANMSANYEMKGGLLKLTIDPANARAAMLIQFKKDGKRYFKAGKPGAPVGAELFVFGTTYKVGQYFQVGTDLDPVPDISEIVEGWPESGKAERKGLDPENGLCLGMGMEMQVSKTLGIFFATLRGGFGFDLGIGSTTMMCGIPPRQLGFNGWRVKGQVYAYASAAVGMEYDLGFTDGRVNILEAFLGMQLKGQFPNPSVFEGRLAGRFSVLGGMVKGKFNMNFEVVSKKDRECLEFLNANQNNLVADLKIVGDKYPANEATKVPIFVKPKLAFNLDVGKEMALEDEDINGNKRLRYFRASFHPTEGHNLWKGKQKIACRATVDPESATLEPAQFLSPFTSYVFKYKLKWEEKLNGKWTDLKDAAGKPVVEEDSMSFTTGKLPDKIVTELLDYHAPGYRQRYWHTGFAKPTVKFKSTVDGVSWEEAYFPTHSPDTAHIPGYGKIAYDYVVKLTKYKNGQEEGGYELPLSEYPGLQNFQIPVPVTSQIGNYFTLTRMVVKNVPGLNVSYAGLNDLINTANDDWKGRLVRLEIVRVPILPKAQTNDETETMMGDDGIEVAIPKRSLVADESQIPVQHGTKILYEYWFATSNYANLADKLMATTTSRFDHNAQRMQFERPGIEEGYTLATNWNYGGRQNFYEFRDDFFGFQNALERFDTFDLVRIRLNAGIRYEKNYAFKQQYDKTVAALPYKWANSVYFNKFKVNLATVGTKEVDLTSKFDSWKYVDFKDNKNYDSQKLKQLLDFFGSVSDLGTATGFAGYDEKGSVENLENDEWTNALHLPGDGIGTLQQSEIDSKTATLKSVQTLRPPGYAGVAFSPSAATFGLLFQHKLSGVTGLQAFALKEVMERGFASRLKSEFIDKWTGLTEAQKDVWANDYWKFFAPATSSTSTDYTSLNAEYKQLRQLMANYANVQASAKKNGDNLAYNDGILFSFPKVGNWTGMNQRVNSANFQRYEVMLKPSREVTGQVNFTAPTNLAAAENPSVAGFYQNFKSFDIFMQSFPKDEKIASIEVQYEKGNVQKTYQTKLFWDVLRREADLYDEVGKRAILFNVELPDGEELNLSELLQLAGTSWAKPENDSSSVRIWLKTDKGSSYTFGGSLNSRDLENTQPKQYKLLQRVPAENTAAGSNRKSAYLFRRGAGSRANDITMELVGNSAVYDFGGCLLVDPEARHIVAYISPDQKLTRYYYAEKGCSQITTDYQMGSPIATLDPTREYKLFAAKRNDSHFKAVTKLDKDFWDEKTGRFFDDASFGNEVFDVAAAPAVANNGGKVLKVPGDRFEAEDYARPNIVKALEVWGKPEYAGEGFAFHDSNSDGTMIYAECSGCSQPYLTGAGVDLIKEFDQNQSNARAVALVNKGEWLTYKINVEKDDNYTLKFGYSAMQQRGRIAFELDGAVMLDTMLNTTANNPKRYNKLTSSSPQYHFVEFLVEKLRLPQGEHTLKIRFFDSNLSLDYLKFEVMKPKASIRVKASGLQILDGNTNLGNLGSTHDFGNVACDETSYPVEFALKNEGNATLALQGSPLVHLDNTADFEVVRSPAAQIMPDSSTIFSIRFKPKSTNVGLRKATVTIRSNDADPTAQEFTFRVLATNNPVEAEVRSGSEVVESSQTAPGVGSPGYFGVVQPGQSETAPFVLHNFGNAEMTGITWEIQGPAASDYAVSNKTYNLGVGEGHSFSVTYTARPGAGGPQHAYLAIGTGDCDESPYLVPLAAIATAPELEVKVASNAILAGATVELGEVKADTAVTTVTVTNLGVEPLTLNGLTLASNDPVGDAWGKGKFLLASSLPNGGLQLGGGNSTNLLVKYIPDPASTNTNAATFSLQNSDSDEGNFTMILTGKKAPPKPLASQESQASSAQTITAPSKQQAPPKAVNRALAFAGSTYVDCGNPPSVQITGSAISLEAWVRFDGGMGEFSVIDKTSPDPGDTGYALRCSANTVVFYIKTDGVKHEVKTTGLLTGKWQHIAGVYDGKRMKVFLDGSLKAASDQAFGNIKDSGGNLWLGNDPSFASPQQGFPGAIDEVRIWKRALSSDEIAARSACELVGSEPGLAAWYDFNQGIPDGKNLTEKMLFLNGGGGSDGSLQGFLLEPYYDTQNNRRYVANWTKGKETASTCPVNAGVPAIGLQGGITGATILENASPNESNGTYFGAIASGDSKEVVFTIVSKGNGPLTLPDNAVKISGDHAADFKLLAQPTTQPIPSNSVRTFVIRFTPVATSGIRNAVVSLASDDPLQPVFSFTIQGVGIKSAGMTVKKTEDNSLIANTVSVYGADFGSVVAGDSASLNFTIQNTATGGVLELTGAAGAKVALSGSRAGHFKVTKQPASSINPNSEATFSIAYLPTANGTHDDVTVNIATNDPANKNYSFKIKGNCPYPALALKVGEQSIADQTSSIGLDFGECRTKMTRTVQVSNTGTGKLEVGSIAISGPHAARFSVSKSKLPSLAPQCPNCESFDLSFDPVGLTDLDGKTAVISIGNNGAGDSKNFEFKVAGKLKSAAIVVSGKAGVAIASNLQLDPKAENGTDFGIVRSEEYTKQSFTVRNTGSDVLVISQKPQLQGDAGFSFSSYEPGTSTNPDTLSMRSLQPGQAWTFWIAFKPTGGVSGTKSAIVSIPTNAINATNFSFKIAGRSTPPGLVVKGGAPLKVVPNSATVTAILDNYTIFEPKGQREFTLENPSDETVEVRHFMMGGGQADKFRLTDFNSFDLAPKASRKITIQHSGSQFTKENAVLTITYRVGGVERSYVFAIKTDPPQAAEIEVATADKNLPNNASINFGNVRMGTVQARTITISNAGPLPLTFSGSPSRISMSGADANQFELVDTDLPAALQPGGSVSFSVKYTPKSGEGDQNAVLTIPNNDPDEGEYKIRLVGNVRNDGVSLRWKNKETGPSIANNDTLLFGFDNLEKLWLSINPNSFLATDANFKLSGANANLFSILTTTGNGNDCGLNTKADGTIYQRVVGGDPTCLNVQFSGNTLGTYYADLTISYTGSTDRLGIGVTGVQLPSVVLHLKVVVGNNPYLGVATTLPGKLEAENFDHGGEGISYHSGFQESTDYRRERMKVDGIGPGQYRLFLNRSEWTEYTVNVAQTGFYEMSYRYMVACGPIRLKIDVDEKEVHNQGLPNKDYRMSNSTGLFLTKGKHLIRLTALGDYCGVSIDYLDFKLTPQTNNTSGFYVTSLGKLLPNDANATPNLDNGTDLGTVMFNAHLAPDFSVANPNETEIDIEVKRGSAVLKTMRVKAGETKKLDLSFLPSAAGNISEVLQFKNLSSGAIYSVKISYIAQKFEVEIYRNGVFIPNGFTCTDDLTDSKNIVFNNANLAQAFRIRNNISNGNNLKLDKVEIIGDAAFTIGKLQRLYQGNMVQVIIPSKNAIPNSSGCTTGNEGCFDGEFTVTFNPTDTQLHTATVKITLSGSPLSASMRTYTFTIKGKKV